MKHIQAFLLASIVPMLAFCGVAESAIQWPAEHPAHAQLVHVDEKYMIGSPYDIYLWWQDSFLWAEVVPLGESAYFCGAGDDHLEQNGNDYITFFTSEVGHFCGDIKYPKVFMVSADLRRDTLSREDGIPRDDSDLIFHIYKTELFIEKTSQEETKKIENPKGLRVYRDGKGSGFVMSDDNAVFCAHRCFLTSDKNARVKLTPAPAVGSKFVRWDGACKGRGKNGCTVKMTKDKWVSAVFKKTQKSAPDNPKGNPEPDYGGSRSLCSSVESLSRFLGSHIVPSGCYRLH